MFPTYRLLLHDRHDILAVLYSAGGRGGEGDEESRDTYGGSSSNSNGGLNDTEQCVSSVLPTDDDEGNSITNSTAYKDIMCNLLCMEKVTNNSIYQVMYRLHNSVG